MTSPHPNWVGLATANIKWKSFVRASEQDLKTTPDIETRTNTELNGDQVKEFYDETIKESDDISVISVIKTKRRKKVIKEESDNSDLELCDPEADNNFLIAVQEDDLISAKKYFTMGINVNCSDRFNWTPLMVAAKAGSTKCIQFLLEKGASIDIFNEKGLDAYDLAIACGNGEIAETIRAYKKKKENRIKREVETIEIADSEYVTCSQCGVAFDKDEKASHIASTVHLMTIPGPAKSNPGFGIAESNLGFRLMEKKGWDGQSGLGRSGEGNKFPVKTILKRDRRGLAEGDSKTARVTHFKANDEESVERVRDVRWKRKAENGTFLPDKIGRKKGKGGKKHARDLEFREELAGL